MLHSVTSPEQKFYSSSVDLTCCVMVTDTRSTWAEGKLALISGKRGILGTFILPLPALSSKRFARRWRECNRRISSPILDDEEEEAWRTRNLDLLSRTHALGGLSDISFEVVESKFGVPSLLVQE